jgi:DNA-binding NarL/FixJ family response regulator
MNRILSVVVVDDQTLVRNGLCGLLALTGEFHVVGQAADGQEALAVVAATRPDVLLLDVRMPVMSGIEALRALNENGSLPPTLLLTTFDDDEALLEGMRAGAKGFMLKDVALERLADAIRRVASGDTLFRPAVTERVQQSAMALAPKDAGLPPVEQPTSRELEILRLMAGGFSNREIADAFCLSEGTVKNHVSSILGKLGVRDRVRAVLKGLELGYI